MNNTGFSLLIVIIGILGGCSIKDDRNDCPEDFNYELIFLYDGNGESDIFSSKIQSVNMYIFNEEGTYVDEYTYSKSALKIFQGANITLPTGIYTVICWSNITELSTITQTNQDSTHLLDYRLFSTPYLLQETITNFDSLYYGKKTIQISQNEEKKDTVFFSSAHINMEVYVEGLSSTSFGRAVGNPRGWIEVKNVYTGYNFNKNVTGNMADMYPDFIYDSTGNIALAKFNLFRFESGNHIIIDIYDGEGNEVYSLNLQDFITTHGIQVVGINEVTIPIYIKFEGVNVNVSVADWNSNDVKPIF
ncbi:MAG: FimB/Mfa2 family fimbrial subunit [Odoribacter sp.]|nr:FimB/Mfa2 family fimbrial subunit [Odoribacter sp.]